MSQDTQNTSKRATSRGLSSRRDFLFGSVAVAGSVGLCAAALACMPPPEELVLEPPARRLIAAAAAQIGVTKGYDPSYQKLAFPGGDISRETGVCTDVIIRAYRDAFNIDLQTLVHQDMASAFDAYPDRWGLTRPDTNIDHRRVPNLQTFFERQNAVVTDGDIRPGDLITQTIMNRPHISIVSDTSNFWGARLLLIHNAGWGTAYDDWLEAWPRTGHYRYLQDWAES